MTIKSSSSSTKEAARNFLAEINIPASKALNLIENWRRLQAGSSHSKCKGCSTS